MAKQEINDLINQAKLNNQERRLQKVVSSESERKEKNKKDVQFLFRLDPTLLKKIKMKALEEETSVKQLLVKAIKNYLL